MEAQELIEALRSLVAPTWREIYQTHLNDGKENFKTADGERMFSTGFLSMHVIYNDEQRIGRINIYIQNSSLYASHMHRLVDVIVLDKGYNEVIDRAFDEWLEARIEWDKLPSNLPEVIKHFEEVADRQRWL